MVSSSATGVGGATIAGLSVNSTTYRDAPGGLVGWSFSNPDYGSQSGNATVTIGQAGSTVTVTPALSSVTYDAQQHGATATWASTGTDDEGGSLTVTYVGIDGRDYASSTTAPTEVGEYRPRPASRATRTTRGAATRPTSPSPRPRPRSRSRASAAR